MERRSLIFVGNWNPILGMLPLDNRDVFWLIQETGKINNVEYVRNDYLIYDSINHKYFTYQSDLSPLELERILDLNDFFEKEDENNELNKESIIQIIEDNFLELLIRYLSQKEENVIFLEKDDLTNTLDLKIRLDEDTVSINGFFELMSNPFGICRGFTHDMITDWCEAFYGSFLYRLKNSFINELSEGIEFEYLDDFEKIRGKVLVDNSTIHLNKEGKLEVIRSLKDKDISSTHQHTIDQIVDIDSIIPKPAKDQLLGCMENQEGLINLENLSIRNAFLQMNTKLLELQNELNTLKGNLK